MTYIESLLKKAVTNNQIREYLIGGLGYEEIPERNAEIVETDYYSRLTCLCSNGLPEKETIANVATEEIVNLLKGDAHLLRIGIIYLRSYCNAKQFGYNLPINEKEFFSKARDILLARKQELQKIQHGSQNGTMWNFVERVDRKVQEQTGNRIL